ncbi:MAG: D-alanine--D-alanine ligase [Nitrospinae bacterium]|nr:D-alanine--D-alanine ligase [Nitrospinota bacterium]
MSRKLRVGVIFGGRSGEHEVSLASAQSVLAAIDRQKFEVVPIGITPEGRWLTGGDPLKALQEGVQSPAGQSFGGAPATEQITSLVIRDEGQRSLAREVREHVDVIFPVLHGPHGEDGTIQGLLELADIPYVGAGVLGSAIGMDKSMMKAIFRERGFPVVEFLTIRRYDWDREPIGVLERIEATLPCPMFVKPANLGSSVGISKVHDHLELERAVALAATYDRKILVERAITCRELECSVLGNDAPIASTIAEIVPHREFYDYEAKYTEGLTDIIIPANISGELQGYIRELAIGAFQAIDAAGMARVDFFLEHETGHLYLNEINTIPGFTATSVYPKLWEASGLPYSELIDRLLQLALERYADKKRSRTTYKPARLARE